MGGAAQTTKLFEAPKYWEIQIEFHSLDTKPGPLMHLCALFGMLLQHTEKIIVLNILRLTICIRFVRTSWVIFTNGRR